jgi:formylmethanofuran dehydrogenase subunit A
MEKTLNVTIKNIPEAPYNNSWELVCATSLEEYAEMVQPTDHISLDFQNMSFEEFTTLISAAMACHAIATAIPLPIGTNGCA